MVAWHCFLKYPQVVVYTLGKIFLLERTLVVVSMIIGKVGLCLQQCWWFHSDTYYQSCGSHVWLLPLILWFTKCAGIHHFLIAVIGLYKGRITWAFNTCNANQSNPYVSWPHSIQRCHMFSQESFHNRRSIVYTWSNLRIPQLIHCWKFQQQWVWQKEKQVSCWWYDTAQ